MSKWNFVDPSCSGQSRTHALLWLPESQSGSGKKVSVHCRPPICESPELPQSSPVLFRFRSQQVACGALCAHDLG